MQTREFEEEPASAVYGTAGFAFEDGVIGTTVSHYKILEKLGEGGMGVGTPGSLWI